MAVFTYRGRDERQARVAGTVTADTPRQARDLLRSRGVAVERLDQQPTRAAAGWWSGWLAGRMAPRWAASVHELSMLLRAGIPLVDALETVGRQYRGRFRAAILGVRDRVAAGSSLAEALAERPDVFDSLSVHLVEVGETSGTLDEVLDELARFKARSLLWKDQVINALLYPALVSAIVLALTIFLMTSVMPTLLENLAETLPVLPWPTRIVKAISDGLLTYGGWLALGVGVVVVGLAAAWRTAWGRRLADRALLSLPIVGPLARKQAIARIAMILATLLKSGVVLTRALQLAARSTSNLILRDALEQCGTLVGAGQDVATALERSGAFPPLAVQIFSVGQETGQLDDVLARLAADYERQVSVAAARFAALLEPALIVILALVEGFVLVAILLPILEAGNVQ